MTDDLVVHDAFVLTVDERNRLYERGTVVVDDGHITEVRKASDGDASIAADEIIDGGG